MEDFLKVLRPVLTTADNYLPGNVFSDAEIQSRVKTSIFQSVPDPKCNYVSFVQVSPDGGADKSLSWKLEQGNAPSVIQFLTTQLNFRIEWTFVNNSEFDFNQKVRFLEVEVGTSRYQPASVINHASHVPKQIAPEPWDNKGNRIIFSVPKPGQTTSGCFVVPGQYQFFVIEDPGKNLDITLKITGFYPKCKVDRWAVSGDRESKFCIKDCNGKFLHAYTNKVSTLGRIQREINPLLLSYQDKVLKEYYFNAGQPCLADLDISQNDTSDEVTITVSSDIYNRNNYIGSGANLFGVAFSCGNSYCAPYVQITDKKPWITRANDQILLEVGTYKISELVLNGQFANASEKIPSSEILKSIFYGCNRADLAFLFYSYADNQPQKFLLSSNPPPLSPDAADDGLASMLVSTYTKADIDILFFDLIFKTDQNIIFETKRSGSKFPYGFRLNSPICRYLTTVNGNYFSFGSKILDCKMKLSKI